MSLFSTAIGWASKGIDSYFGTNISKYTGMLGANTSATLGDVGSALVSSAGTYAAGRFGDSKTSGFTTPTYDPSASRATREGGGSVGTFKAGQTAQSKVGLADSRLQTYYAKAKGYQITAQAIEIAQPKYGQRTKSLQEAQLKIG